MTNLKVKTFARLLISVLFILLLGNLIAHLLSLYYDEKENLAAQILYKAFDFNTELNLPTYFTSMLHLINAILLFIIAKFDNSKSMKYWYALSVLFCFTALDEMLMIHERLNVPFRNFLDASGVFYFTWIIPYSVALILLGILFFQFLKKLPKRTFFYFFLSATLFVTGAIGIELFEGVHYEKYGRFTTTYFIMYTVEETLEMLGLCLFSYALMDYLSIIKSKVKIKLSN